MPMTMLALVRLLVVGLSGLAGLSIATGIEARPVVGVIGGSLLGALAVWLEWRAGHVPLEVDTPAPLRVVQRPAAVDEPVAHM